MATKPTKDSITANNLSQGQVKTGLDNLIDYYNEKTDVIPDTASAIANVPAGNITAITVQAAINELDSEKAKVGGDAAQKFKIGNGTASDEAVALGQFIKSSNATGYVKLPNGVIIQWGTAVGTFSTSTPFAVTFPIAFATACYEVVAMFQSGAQFPVLQVPSFSTTSMNVYQHINQATTFRWIAVGE